MALCFLLFKLKSGNIVHIAATVQLVSFSPKNGRCTIASDLVTDRAGVGSRTRCTFRRNKNQQRRFHGSFQCISIVSMIRLDQVWLSTFHRWFEIEAFVQRAMVAEVKLAVRAMMPGNVEWSSIIEPLVQRASKIIKDLKDMSWLYWNYWSDRSNGNKQDLSTKRASELRV